MVCDACMKIYIVYIRYSVLLVLVLSVSGFDYLIHTLNVNFKIWSGQPMKKWFTLILNVLKIKIILKYTKSQVL